MHSSNPLFRRLLSAQAATPAFITVLFLAFVLGLAAGCGRTPRPAALPPESIVLAFGDSVTYGTGAASGEDYPSRLAASTGWRVINAGVPGEVSEEGLARLPATLDETRPALVLIELGGNDFLHRVPESRVRENLRAMLARVRETGAVPVLIAVPRPSILGAATGRIGDAPLYADLAKETGTTLVADGLSDVLSDETLKADPIHPNARGYERLANLIAATLTREGFLGARVAQSDER